ncbi:MAG TPA: DHA2 family efflux MFS transporter permease subunit [Gaiellaceae bacterium]|nr:DHA2 family efflux MFS transporter permease subunit [Gaiellaceae bacterium]
MVDKVGAKTFWTFVITSIALVMVTLDNLVVTTAIPVIRKDLHASLQSLEWTVNAYTLTFAVLLLTGAALGDRFGRRRMFVLGLAIFTGASAFAALAPSIEVLNVARAMQGVGGAIVTPLTLTLLSAAVPAERRGLALGAWGGIGGLAIALGPLVGGAVVQGISWQWIFWLNVPIGLALIPFAWRRLDESRGPNSSLDLAGLVLASAGLLGIVWGLVRGNEVGWSSPEIVGALAGGALLVVAFVLWELRSAAPMLPMRFFRNRTFAQANLASLLMFFGMFGSIFLLAQFFQTVQGYSPFGSGLRILPWTAMPIFVAPIAGALSDRIPGPRIMGVGLALQAIGLGWIAAVSTPTVPYSDLVAPFVLSGIGMGLFFAPVANVVLSTVRPREEGQASGANNAIRELGGVFGVAVLASIFSSYGGYATSSSFVAGLTPAVWVGAAVVGVGALVALTIPVRRRKCADVHTLEPALEEAA